MICIPYLANLYPLHPRVFESVGICTRTSYSGAAHGFFFSAVWPSRDLHTAVIEVISS